MNHRLFSRIATVICCVSLAAATGCGWPLGYIPSVVQGELAFLGARVPIEAGLDDPTLTEEERDKLAFLIRARDYAEEVVGLNVGNNFQEFVNLHGESLAWNLSASRRDAIDAYLWRVPIAGELPYLGFFDLDQARAERDRLVDAGYDTFIYEVDTYALPWLPDPVSSRVLRRSYGSLADVVMHELLHNTVSSRTNVVFDESLAMFVGRAGGIEFLAHEFGEEAPIIEQTRQRNEDADRFNAFLQEMIDELSVLYESDVPSKQKINDRAAIFEAELQRFADEVLPLMNEPDAYEGFVDFPINNAYLLVNVRYNSDLSLFADIHELTGGSWPDSLAIFTAAAASPDPVQYLEDLLAAAE